MQRTLTPSAGGSTANLVKSEKLSGGSADGGTQRVKRRSTSRGRILAAVFTPAAALLALATSPGAAQTLTWDASGTNPATPVDGSGFWDTTTAALWSNGASDSAWINGDVANIGNGGAAGVITIDDASGTVTANGINFNAATGNYTIAATGPATLTLAGTAIINVSGSLSPTISAPIAGNAGLTLAGTGTLNLTGNNSFGGTVAINSGTLAVGTGGNLGASTNAVALGDGNTSPAALSIGANVTTTVGSLIAASNSATASTIAIGTGATLNINSNVSATGLNAVFQMGANPVIQGVARTSNVTVTGGGSLAVTGGANNSSFIVGVGNTNSSSTQLVTTTLDMTGLTNFSFTTGSGAIPNPNGGSEFAVGVGTDTTGTVNLASGSNTITAGTIDIGDSSIPTPGSSGATGTQVIGSSTGTLNLGTGTNLIQANTILVGVGRASADFKWASATSTGTLTITGAAGGSSTADITVGTASNAAGANAAGRSTFNLAGHNVNVQGGTVIVGNTTAGNLGTQGGGTLTFDNGTFGAVNLELGVATGGNPNGARASNGTFTLGAGGATPPGAVLAVSNKFLLGSTSVAVPDIATFTIKSGGTANISTNIIDNSSGTGASTTSLQLQGGALNMNGFAIGPIGGGTGGTRHIGTITFPVAAVPPVVNSAVLSNLGGTGINDAGLNMTGTGLLILEGSNTYTGGTIVTAGTLQVGQASDVNPMTSPLGATAGNVANASVLSFASSQAVSIPNQITGAGALNQAGTGITTLTNTNLYNGPTTVSKGTLLVNGSIANSATTISGGTLGGSGTTGGVSMSSGTLAPGNSPGILNTGSLSFTGGTLAIELGGANPGNAATSYDQVNVTGAVNLGTATTTLTVSTFGAFTPTLNETFTIIANDSGDPTLGIFTNGATVTDNLGDIYAISYLGDGLTDTNDVVLTTVAVPEPATLGVVGIAMIGLLSRRRQRAIP